MKPPPLLPPSQLCSLSVIFKHCPLSLTHAFSWSPHPHPSRPELHGPQQPLPPASNLPREENKKNNILNYIYFLFLGAPQFTFLPRESCCLVSAAAFILAPHLPAGWPPPFLRCAEPARSFMRLLPGATAAQAPGWEYGPGPSCCQFPLFCPFSQARCL